MKLAVGFFDGVHLGHQTILRGADAALTFVNHPLSVLAPERVPQLLMTLEERLRTIHALGVAEVRVLEFTPKLAALSAADFARRHLGGEGMVVRVGANWRFGKGAAGDADWLRAHGWQVEKVPLSEYAGKPISSSRIREALAAGKLSEAAAMLGREYSVRGAPAVGKGEGARLGFPTLNLPRPLSVKRGVYSAVVNYGVAPTYGESAWREPVMEVHLLEYLREERKFASVAELREQIARDIARVTGEKGEQS